MNFIGIFIASHLPNIIWWSSIRITVAPCSVQIILQHIKSHLQNAFHQSAYMYTVFHKRHPIYFLNNSVKHQQDFRKIW